MNICFRCIVAGCMRRKDVYFRTEVQSSRGGWLGI
ncbi:hypothetical protein COPEUT_01081 [Coprococcus eutactus ATCC 27759]|nr:hypothetical protein COPEUT_01081 [Coprococcus eutactus ATCC 27759]